jgi:putative component of membrane protein insertase Oxa1/YidC/SpoIIIJ protein YidD
VIRIALFLCYSLHLVAGVLLEGMPLPWGKDATLAYRKYCRDADVEIKHDALEQLAGSLIRFHRTVISEADGPRSHFLPSSSMYMRDAIDKYGLCVGIIYGCDRLMRENSDPWVYPVTRNAANEVIKSDPVP